MVDNHYRDIDVLELFRQSACFIDIIRHIICAFDALPTIDTAAISAAVTGKQTDHRGVNDRGRSEIVVKIDGDGAAKAGTWWADTRTAAVPAVAAVVTESVSAQVALSRLWQRPSDVGRGFDRGDGRGSGYIVVICTV